MDPSKKSYNDSTGTTPPCRRPTFDIRPSGVSEPLRCAYAPRRSIGRRDVVSCFWTQAAAPGAGFRFPRANVPGEFALLIDSFAARAPLELHGVTHDSEAF